jgi:polysaccharide deacetylase family protein (PEP-CTERM system associated)
LTFDVEDWFQVENFKHCIPFESWTSYNLRVEKNTHELLELLDSIPLDHLRIQNSKLKTQNCLSIRATFFVLGWIAERLPQLVREIHSRGHEVASHGYCHELCNTCATKDLKRDLSDSKKLLEDIIGGSVYGYRAPSFSITNESLKIIRDCGYVYDSSYNSFSMHGRYGKIDFFRNGNKGIVSEIFDGFFELPISNLQFKIQNLTIPWGGGAYFRLMPFSLFKRGITRILHKKGAYLFYMHPWELDAGQPRVTGVSRFFKFRHYTNLNKSTDRLRTMINYFSSCRFATCHEYLQLSDFLRQA